MPIRNEAAFVASSLNAVLGQDYPTRLMEVIVADGVSTDDTREIVQSLQSENPNLRLIDNGRKIVASGLNAAVGQASGEIIVRVDGHCRIAPDYVRRCVEHLLNDGVDCVGGPLHTIGETSLAQVVAVAMSSPFGVGDSAFRTLSDKTMLTDTVAFPAYNRSIMDLAGPFDEELVRNQDDEYNYRIRRLGAKVLLASDVQSEYYGRTALRSLWRQYFQYGYWKVRVMQKHPLQMRPRQFVPPTFVTALLISMLLAPLSAAGRWSLFLVGGSYILANLVATALTARKLAWRQLALLPLVFAILHLAYGLGFLTALLRFWNRWWDRETRNGI